MKYVDLKWGREAASLSTETNLGLSVNAVIRPKAARVNQHDREKHLHTSANTLHTFCIYSSSTFL